jgi:hypothetical protein
MLVRLNARRSPRAPVRGIQHVPRRVGRLVSLRTRDTGVLQDGKEARTCLCILAKIDSAADPRISEIGRRMPPWRPEISGPVLAKRPAWKLRLSASVETATFSPRSFERPAGCPVVGRDFGAEKQCASTSPCHKDVYATLLAARARFTRSSGPPPRTEEAGVEPS